MPNNQWKFIAVTYDGNTLSTYIDGVLNNTKTTSGAIANTSSSLNIGREPSGATFFFDGDIDDVMIYNRSLSAGEVVQIFNQNITE
ncbi:MAG: LamG domain-containing protein [Saprospiraceae bacterium]|nr:LamG domain-containing protein [Saprospiraceae bacterium]